MEGTQATRHSSSKKKKKNTHTHTHKTKTKAKRVIISNSRFKLTSERKKEEKKKKIHRENRGDRSALREREIGRDRGQRERH